MSTLKDFYEEYNDKINELKAENKRLKKQLDYDSRYNDLQAEIDYGERIIEKYKNVLQEIKAIAEKTIDIYYPDYYDEGFEEDIVTEFAKQVLDLISKVESEG